MRALVILPLALALLAPAAVDPGAIDPGIAHICGAERVRLEGGGGPRRVGLQAGVGTAGFPVRTTSAEAQRWFDQGLAFYHAFYHTDARLAFDRAAAADPGCALCRWGQALSRGPTQNFDVGPDDAAAAAGFARQALAASRTPQEILLAEAMIARARADQTPAAEEAFATALLKASALAPDGLDLRLLAAESLLTADRRGDHATPRRAIAILEPILARRPDHAGAIHYYIHATEAAGRPGDALPYARRLAALAPEASHLIHMAAHTWIHLGGYRQVAALNARALEVDAEHERATGAAGPLGAADYYGHNLGFGLAGAMMAGDGPLAVRFADHARVAMQGAVPERARGALARTYAAYGRYAPARALALPDPGPADPFGRMMWRYARGEALAAQGDAAGVLRESQAIADGLSAVGGRKDVFAGPPELARQVLQGRAQMLQGRPAAAARTFAAAADFQERQGWGMDPPPFWYPVRRSLAAAELAAGRYAEAVRQAGASLKAWPGDALALKVRAEAERRLGRTAAAAQDEAAARSAWDGDLAETPLGLI